MMHITYADKSLLVGDAAGEAISEYAAALAKHQSADTVTLSGFGADGDDVEATFLLDAGTVLMVESTHSSIPEPDNSEAVEYMREKTGLLNSPPSPGTDDEMPSSEQVDGYFDTL
jgi:hypothetical protein